MSLTGKDATTSRKSPDSTFGVYGNSRRGYGVVGLNDIGVAVLGESGFDGEEPDVIAMIGVEGYSTGDIGGTGVLGAARGPKGIGVFGSAQTGVVARSFPGGTGVDAVGNIGVLGRSANGIAIYGKATGTGNGVRADSANGIALIANGDGPGGVGVLTAGTQAAVGASNTSSGTSATLAGTALAGQFIGDVTVSASMLCNTMIAFVKMFEIDHPLEPERRILRHATVESAEMKNLYDGIAVLDQSGESVVTLPAWFEALNGNFRYQLTCLGSYSDVYIAEEINNNQFRIAGGTPGARVSWMVTGIRQDASARAHILQVEEDKSVNEHGLFLDPAAFGLSDDQGIWLHRQPQIAVDIRSSPDLPAQNPSPALMELLRRQEEHRSGR